MNSTLRSIAFSAAAAIGLGAFAQPLPPYSVTVMGTVSGCTANSFVNIQTMAGTLPAMDIDVPVLPPNCFYSVTLPMDSYGGGFVVTTACLGAIQTQIVQYQVNSLFPDSTYAVANLNCGNSTVDCNGVPGGPDMPGTPCNTPNGAVGTWSANCDCVIGGGNTDCLGILNGPNLPGTSCTTFFGIPGTWSANCVCVADSSNGNVDCMGIVNGPNVPGTACQNPATGIWGTWAADCTCTADSTGGAYDCLGVLNGSAQPGTPCWLFGTNYIGVWDANCVCADSTNTGGCAAGFYAIQAYEIDSANPNGTGSPIPYEIWVWNLSSGVGPMTYSWDFGDGSTSTSAYPTHAYSGNGPYLLCLTINDASGCTSVYCDSISIDPDGILNGMIIEGEVNGNGARLNGFTINVHNPLTLGLTEPPAIADLRAWPNPASDELNLSLSARFDGLATITVMDVNGREVIAESHSINTGRNIQRLDVSALASGVYTVRATDRATGTTTSLRFAKGR